MSTLFKEVAQKLRTWRAGKPGHRPPFRPRMEALEDRLCPAADYFQWAAPADGLYSVVSNWRYSTDDINWGPARRAPTVASDYVQFDGTSTKKCTVDQSVLVKQLTMSVGGGGNDQIILSNNAPTYYYLEAQMNWTADGVQVNFSGTANQLIADGGSSIGSFKFTGAKGSFIVPSGPRGGTTTWNTGAASTTTAQIDIEGGPFDLKGTGSITSSYGGYDVWVGSQGTSYGTLKFDYGDGVGVVDVLDNGGDNAGYIVTAYNTTTGVGGKIITTANTFTVGNSMPVRNNGQVTVDTGVLGFDGSVAGTGYTAGASYFEPETNIQASTTVLHHGGLSCIKGFRQNGGTFQVGTGGATLVAGVGNSIDFEGGSIKFPGGQDYKTFTVTADNVMIHSTTVNMKLDGQSNAAGHFDQILSPDGKVDINAASTLNVTVNNALKSALYWDLIETQAGADDITGGGFGTVTPANTFNPQLGQILNVNQTTVYRFTAK